MVKSYLKNPLSSESVQTVAQSLRPSSVCCSEPLAQMLLITVRHQTCGGFHPECRSGSQMWASAPRVMYFNSPVSLSKEGNLQVFTSAAQTQTAVNKKHFCFHTELTTDLGRWFSTEGPRMK